MSQLLDPLAFPLHGSRLIEASAGTGKTWTIAALYLRLVLGHGGDAAFVRPLLPSDILVMTFTRAATRELSNRVRERLVQAAAYFRGELGHDDPARKDPYLRDLAASYADDSARVVAAHRLVLAAETMDEAAIFTIDAWCQRMLREHAFDSG
ncbi:MAG TPA: exodeoxyribonuclease V subunit beta, partial [Massilia sp.]|nr:exodeoxyribonuclease V subunit beta [Massilia sp.]